MPIDVAPELRRILLENRGPDRLDPALRAAPDYGIEAALDGSRLDVVLTFRRDASYCCMEWGCHLPLVGARPWTRLRAALEESRIAPAERLELTLRVVIEDGAWFYDLMRPDREHRGRYAFARASASIYTDSATEAASSG